MTATELRGAVRPEVAEPAGPEPHTARARVQRTAAVPVRYKAAARVLRDRLASGNPAPEAVPALLLAWPAVAPQVVR